LFAGKVVEQAALADPGLLGSQIKRQVFHAAFLNNAVGGVQQGSAGFFSRFWHTCGPRLKLYLDFHPSSGMNQGRKHCFIWIIWYIYTVQTV
jgi:hypothetical protein